MNARPSIGVAVVSIAAATGATWGQTITVTTAADVVDVDWQVATIDDLPGPDGKISLSEAFIASNHTAGHQTIGFAVPQDEWTWQFLFPGRVVFLLNTGFFLHADESVTLDGTTQTAFTGDTNPDGCEVTVYQHDLSFAAGSTIIGLDSTEVFAGANATLLGNTQMDITVSGGSGSLVQGNSGGTLKLNGASDAVVVGNTFQRIRVLGGSNNVIGGPAPEDRNYFTGYGNWSISSGLPSGTTVQVAGTVGTVIENNWIGTTTDGLAQGNPASTIGVSFEGTNSDIVVRNNLIAGIRATGIGTWAGYQFGWAVIFWGSGGSNIELTGNTIGLDANGDPLLGSVWGIDVATANGSGIYTDVRIGGALPGQGNVVAGHLLDGISVAEQCSGVLISGNAIHDNGGIGIDLLPGNGVTFNDDLDLDGGANGLQNHPEVLAASSTGSSITIEGILDSAPMRTFDLEFFASDECDPTGFGEGQVFLGTTATTTDATGRGVFIATFAAAVTPGAEVTATATSATGDSSEFSACRPVEPGVPVLGDATGDGLANVDDIVEIVLRWGPCAGSPAECAADLNDDGLVGVDDIVMVVLHWTGP